jgi:hypothetical protein
MPSPLRIHRYRNKRESSINSVRNTSTVPIRLCTRCRKSSPIRAAAVTAPRILPVSSRAKTYTAAITAVPAAALMHRQPKGVIPNSRMPRERIALPRGGWVHS